MVNRTEAGSRQHSAKGGLAGFAARERAKRRSSAGYPSRTAGAAGRKSAYAGGSRTPAGKAGGGRPQSPPCRQSHLRGGGCRGRAVLPRRAPVGHRGTAFPPTFRRLHPRTKGEWAVLPRPNTAAAVPPGSAPLLCGSSPLPSYSPVLPWEPPRCTDHLPFAFLRCSRGGGNLIPGAGEPWGGGKEASAEAIAVAVSRPPARLCASTFSFPRTASAGAAGGGRTCRSGSEGRVCGSASLQQRRPRRAARDRVRVSSPPPLHAAVVARPSPLMAGGAGL